MPIAQGRRGAPGVLAVPVRRFLTGKPFRSQKLSTLNTSFPVDIVVENVTEEFFAEPLLAAAPAGIDDLDFHVLNIPPKPARELRMR